MMRSIFARKRPSFSDQLTLFENTPGAVLLDVRTKEEYAAGHIPGSINLPLSSIEDISLSREHPLFVYCQSGMRSRAACAQLARRGYTVTDLGGILQYQGPLA